MVKVSASVPEEVYVSILQLVDSDKQYKDISTCIRELLSTWCRNVVLDDVNRSILERLKFSPVASPSRKKANGSFVKNIFGRLFK